MIKSKRFEIYRYQILPKDRVFQIDLFDGISSLDELLRRKNDIFEAELKNIRRFRGKRADIISRLIFERDNFFLFRFAVNRSLTRETEDFREEEIQNWPSFFVCVWNDPSQQIIAIQERKEAFAQTSSPINFYEKAINNFLINKQLRVYIQPQFEAEEFWKIIERYKGKIKEISFELITPNMANISGVLSDDLKAFAQSTNTGKSKLMIGSDPDSALTIDKDNPQIESLVEYSSQGGGNISVKVLNLKRRIQTSKTKKSFEVEELQIEGLNVEALAEFLKSGLLQ